VAGRSPRPPKIRCASGSRDYQLAQEAIELVKGKGQGVHVQAFP